MKMRPQDEFARYCANPDCDHPDYAHRSGRCEGNDCDCLGFVPRVFQGPTPSERVLGFTEGGGSER